MCSTLGKLCLILYMCYGLFYCSYFSDAEDCIILAGIPFLFKEKPENVLIWGQDQKDYPMSIKIKQRILSMDTDIFQVFVEETHIFECDNFLKHFVGYWHVFMSWIWPTPKRGKKLSHLYRTFWLAWKTMKVRLALIEEL